MKKQWLSVLLVAVMAIACFSPTAMAASEYEYQDLAKYSSNLTGATWYWPIHGHNSPESAFSRTVNKYEYIESSYGYRGRNGQEKYYRNHYGVDVVEPFGKEVYPVRAGTVEEAHKEADGKAGRYVVINHGDGYYSVYMHLSNITVNEYDSVNVYTQIGAVGGSGDREDSYVAHLHLGIHYGTKYSSACNVNPCPIGYGEKGTSFKKVNGGKPDPSASINYVLLPNCDHSAGWQTIQKPDGSYAATCKNCGTEYALPNLDVSTAGTYNVTSTVSLCTNPYQDSRTNNQLMENDTIEIAGSVKNAYGNLWHKTSDGKWVYSDYLSLVKAAGTVISFTGLTTPGTLTVGSKGSVDGRITSTKSPITSVKAEVINNATAKVVVTSPSSGFSVQSYGPLKDSKVNTNLKLDTLPTGTYYIKYTATAKDGTTATGQTATFQVVDSHTHTYMQGYEAAHPHKVYMKCSVCGEYYYTGATTSMSSCEICNPSHTHTLTHVAAKTVTCETDGNIEYWYCSECGKYFANLSATTEIAGAPLPIEKLGHKLSHVPAKAATETAEGNIEYWSCSRCGKYFSDSATTREISLSSTVISKLTPVPTHTPAVTADIIDSGTCGVWGDNATWTLDFDGTLTISGRGGMANYKEHEVSYYVHTIDSPWDQYRDNIQKIVVGEGITSLGMNAFSRFTNVTSVLLPSSLTTIGINAFRLCNMLKKINIPNGVSTIGIGAFWASGLSEVVLPDNITNVEGNMFSGCGNLTRVTIPRSVMSIDEWAFFFCDSLTDVYYSGSSSDWNKISIADKDSSNKYLFDATIHYNSTGPTDTTNEPSPQPVVMSKIDVHFNRHTNYIQGQFTDVPANQWFTSGVTDAYEFGLMKGNSASTFNPYGDVTLAEAITMAARIHAIYTNGEENFVQSGTWYQVYLDYAYNNGIISRAYYNADVSRKATRAQFAEFFANALPDGAIYPTNAIADNAIPDVPMGMTYAPYVYKLYRAGILTGGDSMGTFSPDTYITRSEAATIVSRMAESNNRKSFTL